MFLIIALVVTLTALLFAHDVSRAAHNSSGPLRSENRSFGQLANVLVSQENLLDAHLTNLLSNGHALSRPVFVARLSQLAQQLSYLSTESDQLRRPTLAHRVNTVLEQLTDQRVLDYDALLDSVASSLELPWQPLTSAALSASAAQASLNSTSAQWGLKRWSLARAPGRVKLEATTTFSAHLDLSSTLSTLKSSPSLKLVRGVGIAAVQVTPSPLPAPIGDLLLPPVSSFQIGVSVLNGAYTTQPVTLIVTLVPIRHSAPDQRQVLRATLGPLQAFSFMPQPLTTSASEQATLIVSLAGAPSAPHMVRTRVYHVKLSPSGAG